MWDLASGHSVLIFECGRAAESIDEGRPAIDFPKARTHVIARLSTRSASL